MTEARSSVQAPGREPLLVQRAPQAAAVVQWPGPVAARREAALPGRLAVVRRARAALAKQGTRPAERPDPAPQA
jgi:hypothetical protein